MNPLNGHRHAQYVPGSTMKKAYETAMINHGGRNGEVEAPNGSMHMKITPPGIHAEGTNPEHNGIMIPITAWLINKFSSRNLYLSAMTIFLIGTITCFTEPNFSTLLIGRLIQACGVGVSMPLLQNIMLSIFPPEKRGCVRMSIKNQRA